MAKSPNWSQEEIGFLTEFYPSMGIKWCASKLPLRTENAVNAAAYTLGIRKEEPRRFIRYFKNIYICHISNVQAMKFMEWMYHDATIFLQRKKDKYESLARDRESSKKGEWARCY